MLENKVLTEYVIDSSIWGSIKKDLVGYNNILISGGEKALDSIKESLIPILKGLGVNYSFIVYGKECSWSNIDKIKYKSAKEIDLIIGVGGGKALDTAKAAANLNSIDIFTIPTISSTCAATTALSVIYGDGGEFSQLYYLNKPPKKTYIDLSTLIKAPSRYFKAGMGDTLAKYYEVKLLTNNLELNYSSNLGVNISNLCKDSILANGEKAYKDNVNNSISNEFKEVVTTNIITTGIVSSLIDENFNGCIAHSVAMGFTVIEGFEEDILHGETVAYGILIQVLLEGNIEEYAKLKEFYKNLSLPTSLNDMSLDDRFELYKTKVLDKILTGENTDGFSFFNRRNLLKKLTYVA